jgi:acetyl esterase/lipase
MIENGLARALLKVPPPILARCFPRRASSDGVLLDPTVHFTISLLRWSRRPEYWQLAVDEARSAFLDALKLVDLLPAPRVAHVEDRTIPGPAGGIPIRIYRGPAKEEALPALVFFHGGGFVLGSLDSHDGPCREIAKTAECAVVAVDYRLAPEHKFPAAVDDARAAFQWIESHAGEMGIDRTRLAIGGDSAGGNISTVVARELRGGDGSRQPIAEMLIYPATDMRGGTPSRQQFAGGYLLPKKTIDWFHAHYGADALDPRGSPILAKDDALKTLPPTLIVTAGFDPLHDEGVTYAEKLRALGVEVEHRNYPAMVHGFFSMAGAIEDGRRVLADSAKWLRDRFTATASSTASSSHRLDAQASSP